VQLWKHIADEIDCYRYNAQLSMREQINWCNESLVYPAARRITLSEAFLGDEN